MTIDPRFKDCFVGHARVERLWTGARWSEGPAWFAAGRYLVWSDIPNNRMLRWDETDGSVSAPPAVESPVYLLLEVEQISRPSLRGGLRAPDLDGVHHQPCHAASEHCGEAGRIGDEHVH